MDPKCGLAAYYMGLVQTDLEQWEPAEQSLQKAIKLMMPDRRPIEGLKLLPGAPEVRRSGASSGRKAAPSGRPAGIRARRRPPAAAGAGNSTARPPTRARAAATASQIRGSRQGWRGSSISRLQLLAGEGRAEGGLGAEVVAAGAAGWGSRRCRSALPASRCRPLRASSGSAGGRPARRRGRPARASGPPRRRPARGGRRAGIRRPSWW